MNYENCLKRKTYATAPTATAKGQASTLSTTTATTVASPTTIPATHAWGEDG